MKPEELLAVLKTGASVEWDSGYKCSGIVGTNDIRTYENGSYTGLWNLDLEGATKCLEEKAELERRNLEEE